MQAHSPVCSTLELHKTSSQFFLWCGKVGGGGVWRGGGGGGGCLEGGRGCLEGGRGGGPCFRR